MLLTAAHAPARSTITLKTTTIAVTINDHFRIPFKIILSYPGAYGFCLIIAANLVVSKWQIEPNIERGQGRFVECQRALHVAYSQDDMVDHFLSVALPEVAFT